MKIKKKKYKKKSYYNLYMIFFFFHFDWFSFFYLLRSSNVSCTLTRYSLHNSTLFFCKQKKLLFSLYCFYFYIFNFFFGLKFKILIRRRRFFFLFIFLSTIQSLPRYQRNVSRCLQKKIIINK